MKLTHIIHVLHKSVADQGFGHKLGRLVVQKNIFTNLDLFQGIFLTYISALFLDSRIVRTGRGVRQIILIARLVFGGIVSGLFGRMNEESVWDC